MEDQRLKDADLSIYVDQFILTMRLEMLPQFADIFCGLFFIKITIVTFHISVRTNVLHPLNWTEEAGVVLRQFEQEVIRKAKTQGYDGQNDTR